MDEPDELDWGQMGRGQGKCERDIYCENVCTHINREESPAGA